MTCKLIDETEKYLIVTLPVEDETRRTKILTKGTKLFVQFIKEKHAVYQFESEVINHN